MGSEVISIQNGGGMLTLSIRRAHGVRTKVCDVCESIAYWNLIGFQYLISYPNMQKEQVLN